MVGYYAERALEYERIYQKPERQDDLSRNDAVGGDFCIRFSWQRPGGFLLHCSWERG